MQWWRFGRDVSYDVVENGHEGPVFAIQHVPAHNPEQDDQNKGFVFSCSLDNTVRVWDPYDMKCLRVLHEDRSELSAMVRRVRYRGRTNVTIRTTCAAVRCCWRGLRLLPLAAGAGPAWIYFRAERA